MSNNVIQLYDNYENCPMWLLSYFDGDELDVVQFHSEEELYSYTELMNINYYCVEELFV